MRLMADQPNLRLNLNRMISISAGFLTGFGIAIPGLLQMTSGYYNHTYLGIQDFAVWHVPTVISITIAFICPFGACFGMKFGFALSNRIGVKGAMLPPPLIILLGATIALLNSLVFIILGTLIMGLGLGMANMVPQIYVYANNESPTREVLEEMFDTSKTIGTVVAAAISFAALNLLPPYVGYYVVGGLIGFLCFLLSISYPFLNDVPMVSTPDHPFDKIHLEFRPHTAVNVLSKFFRSAAGFAMITMLMPVVYNNLGIDHLKLYLSITVTASGIGLVASFVLYRRYGRRRALLVGSPIIVFSVGLILLMNQLKSYASRYHTRPNQDFDILTMTFMCLYIVGYMFCFGPMKWIHNTYPPELKWVGNINSEVVSVATSYFMALLIACLYSIIQTNVLYLFVGLSILMMIMIFWFLPETRRMSYNEITFLLQTHPFWRRHFPAA